MPVTSSLSLTTKVEPSRVCKEPTAALVLIVVLPLETINLVLASPLRALITVSWPLPFTTKVVRLLSLVPLVRVMSLALPPLFKPREPLALTVILAALPSLSTANCLAPVLSATAVSYTHLTLPTT